MASTFNPPLPAVGTHILLSFPTPQILLVTFNRPSAMNSINSHMHNELSAVWSWYDSIPSLRCAVVTGAAPPVGTKTRRAFCAGADLKEWNANAGKTRMPTEGGFAGLSTRRGKKPVISAVHGVCLGGGLEAAGNTDLVIAHKDSIFALPETQRGVAPLAGFLPRLARIVGMQRACELAMTGKVLTAVDAKEWGLVNEVVEGDIVDAALRWAQKIAEMSPDSIIVTREGLKSAWDGIGVNEATAKVEQGVWRKLQEGENIKEGLRAFVEKRSVRWVDSKL
ncbi:enoyl-CoA hydratase [Sphaerosporella brunnea]|uniref:Enoyl-CoA hydratase n=1 Tax=Sphaerosporella brunnea TaxID=1250544 RepID=A0A5J5ESE8_9PEZI|nr:enoyl-CoA hydratase [Sphaerosporella brunnea]